MPEFIWERISSLINVIISLILIGAGISIVVYIVFGIIIAKFLKTLKTITNQNKKRQKEFDEQTEKIRSEIENSD